MKFSLKVFTTIYCDSWSHLTNSNICFILVFEYEQSPSIYRIEIRQTQP
jgi:hypothetical protein